MRKWRLRSERGGKCVGDDQRERESVSMRERERERERVCVRKLYASDGGYSSSSSSST